MYDARGFSLDHDTKLYLLYYTSNAGYIRLPFSHTGVSHVFRSQAPFIIKQPQIHSHTPHKNFILHFLFLHKESPPPC